MPHRHNPPALGLRSVINFGAYLGPAVTASPYQPLPLIAADRSGRPVAAVFALINEFEPTVLQTTTKDALAWLSRHGHAGQSWGVFGAPGRCAGEVPARSRSADIARG